MIRRRRSRTDDSVTLFPFLAVLICTMGSLIVLLVIVVQQARANAVAATQQAQDVAIQTRAAEKAENEQLQAKRRKIEDLQWQIEVLRQTHDATLADLQRKRDELADTEDAIRELKRRMQDTVDQAKRLDKLADGSDTQRDELERKADALRRKIAMADQKLAELRAELSQREQSFAIVVYDGPQGTNRRPIYIECVEEKIILQPEGLELTARDFRGALKDDNPLAAALRAKGDYLQEALADSTVQPYPLLIVRPGGAHAYAAARAALKSWNSEFGYELIEDDLALDFPQPDNGLRRVMAEAIADARRRNQLVQAAGSAYRRQAERLLRASSNGGFVSIDGADSVGGRRGFGNAADGNSPFASRGRSQRNAATNDSGSNGSGNFGSGNGLEDYERDDPNTRSGTLGGSFSAAPSSSQQAAADSSNPLRSSGTGEDVSYGSATDENRAHPGNSTTGGFPNTMAHSDHATGGTSDGSSQGREGTSSVESTASPLGNQAAGNVTTSQATSGAEGAGGNASRSSDRGSQSGDNATASMSFAATPSIAQSRGADWALPNRGQGATGITRPIRVVCQKNRLLLVPENVTQAEPVTIRLEGAIREEMDAFISSVWQRVDKWGIAGDGLYWKPILLVDVAPDAEQRFAELQRLLDRSGVRVKRR